MDSDDSAGLGLISRQDYVVARFYLPSIRVAGDVIRNRLDVTGRLQIVKRLRRLLLVLPVLIDHVIQRFEILAEIVFPCPREAVAVNRHGHAEQDEYDADHHHHFDQREALAPGCTAAFCSWSVHLVIGRTQ